jgi:hypothetical protein
MLYPRLSDIEGYLVLITPLAYELQAACKHMPEPREAMRCDLVVLDPPIYGPRHMAVSVGSLPTERTEVVLPARFLDMWIAAVGVVTYCRQRGGETAGRLNRYQRMGGPKAWGVRPVTLSDQAILTRYRGTVL